MLPESFIEKFLKLAQSQPRKPRLGNEVIRNQYFKPVL